MTDSTPPKLRAAITSSKLFITSFGRRSSVRRMLRGHVPSWASLAVAAVFCLLPGILRAQGRGGQPPQPPSSPHASAPVDLTGYWVSVITEDWRFRMVTPPKGDYPGVPLNPEGRKLADQWDPATDISAGEQCRAFGAPGVMRLPVRLHVTWQDEGTLKMEADNGNQVRLFHFDKAASPPAQPSWQGFSIAEWENVQQGQGLPPAGGGGGAGGVGGFGASVPSGAPLSGSLKVVTTKLRPGYLRRNGVPYSGNSLLTEFFDRSAGPNGDSWLILTSIFEDPQYLQQPFVLSTHYKQEPDGSKFNPRPCEITPPVEAKAAR